MNEGEEQTENKAGAHRKGVGFWKGYAAKELVTSIVDLGKA